jgi:DNA-binding LacI/PurR family transcriptional regulator
MKNKNSKKQINILVAVKISHTSGRDLLSGIFKFLEANVSWQIHLVQTTEEFSAKLREQFNQNDFDGIIATFPISDEAIDLLAASDLPTVLVNIEDKRLLNRNGKTSFIKNDNAAIGKKAANLFLTNG